MRALSFCCISLLVADLAAAAPTVSSIVDYGSDDSYTPPRIVMHIVFKDEHKHIVPIKWQGLATKAESYHVTETLDGKKTSVAIEAPVPGGKSDGFVQSITLTSVTPFNEEATYFVTYDPGAIILSTSDGEIGFAEKLSEPPKNQLKLEQEYTGNKNFENKVELAGGTGGGVVSARLTYSASSDIKSNDTFQQYGWDLMGKADCNLLASEKEHYFNSIVGQARLFWLGSFNKENPDFSGYFDLGANTSVESDQTVGTVDYTVGLSSYLRLKNPVTTKFQDCVDTLIRPFGSESHRVGLAPLLILGYDYVNHVKQDTVVDTGNHRAKVNFYWTLHIFESQQIPLYHTETGYDADFIIDVETLYDFETSKILNNSKLTLDISRHKTIASGNISDKSPSFVLTYAQGKATPTFKHFDAFLAGLKIPF